MLPRFEQFVRERQFLSNVSPSTLEWYKHSFKWLHSESPSQDDLKEAVLRMREKGLKATGCNSATVALTLDNLDFTEFGAMLKPVLDGRRLFVSACQVVNIDLASAILPHSGCYSLVGSRDRISFGDSALMWASFYHLMLRDREQEEIKGGKIRWGLRRLKRAFGIEFDYFKPASNSQGFEKVDIEVR